MQSKGMFITFEGGEGAGKSTQVSLLAKYLENKGKEVITTREPGGSDDAEDIRKILISGGKDRWDPLTELLLFSAARRNHLQTKILPALSSGKWVVSDRFMDSTTAYQGYGYGDKAVPLDTIYTIYHMIAEGFMPDLTFILDIPVAKGMERVMVRGEDKARFEQMDLSFHEKLRSAYLEIAKQNSSRCIVINALQTKEQIYEQITDVIKQRFSL